MARKSSDVQKKATKEALKIASNKIMAKHGIRRQFGSVKLPKSTIHHKVMSHMDYDYLSRIDAIKNYTTADAPKQLRQRHVDNFRQEKNKEKISKRAAEAFRKEEKQKKAFKDLPSRDEYIYLSDEERARAYLREEEFMKTHTIEGNKVITEGAEISKAKLEKIRSDYLQSSLIPKPLKDYIKKSDISVVIDLMEFYRQARNLVESSKSEFYSMALAEFYATETRSGKLKSAIKSGKMEPINKRKGKLRKFNSEFGAQILANFVSFQISNHDGSEKDKFLNKAAKIKDSRGNQVLPYEVIESYYDSLNI